MGTGPARSLEELTRHLEQSGGRPPAWLELAWLRAPPEADAHLASLLGPAQDPDLRIQAARLPGARGATGQVPKLLELFLDEELDDDLGLAAVDALEELGPPARAQAARRRVLPEVPAPLGTYRLRASEFQDPRCCAELEASSLSPLGAIAAVILDAWKLDPQTEVGWSPNAEPKDDSSRLRVHQSRGASGALAFGRLGLGVRARQRLDAELVLHLDVIDFLPGPSQPQPRLLSAPARSQPAPPVPLELVAQVEAAMTRARPDAPGALDSLGLTSLEQAGELVTGLLQTVDGPLGLVTLELRLDEEAAEWLRVAMLAWIGSLSPGRAREVGLQYGAIIGDASRGLLDAAEGMVHAKRFDAALELVDALDRSSTAWTPGLIASVGAAELYSGAPARAEARLSALLTHPWLSAHTRRRAQELLGQALAAQGRSTKASPGVPGARVGRNEPCPCGSGKKAKKCCRS